MIRVTAKVDEMSTQFVISGHSGLDEKGKDIVCAAVSVLVNHMANLIEAWAEQGVVELKLIQLEEPNHIFCLTRGNPVVNAAVDTYVNIFLQIAEQYPDNIRVTLL